MARRPQQKAREEQEYHKHLGSLLLRVPPLTSLRERIRRPPGPAAPPPSSVVILMSTGRRGEPPGREGGKSTRCPPHDVPW